jgi:hypothetical protein
LFMHTASVDRLIQWTKTEHRIFWNEYYSFDEGEHAPAAASFAGALPPEEAAAGVEAWFLNRAPGESTFVEAVKLRAKDGKPVPALLGVLRSVSRKRELLRVLGFACPLPADAAAADGASSARHAAQCSPADTATSAAARAGTANRSPVNRRAAGRMAAEPVTAGRVTALALTARRR